MRTRVKTASELITGHPVVKTLAKMFARKGFQLFAVGGVVRDALLGVMHEDIDCATNATPEQVRELVESWADDLWDIGAKFGTMAFTKGATQVEVTTFRSDEYQPESRKPRVTLEANIETDLSRRDFTVNSMAVNALTGEFLDPYNGISDLEARELRTPVSARQSFDDDPLRMLRAFRFASTLVALPTPEVLQAVRDMGQRLDVVSKERVKDELSKLMTGTAPTPAIHLMVQTGLMSHVAPEIMELAYCYDPDHRHKDLLEHTLTVVERTPPELSLRLAALFHDVGKPATKTDNAEGIHFFQHEVVGARMAAKRLRALRFPAAVIQEVKQLIYMHMRFHTYQLGWTDHAVRKYVRDCGPLLEKINTLVNADCTTRNPAQARKYASLLAELGERIIKLEEEEETAKMRPPIDGIELMEYLKVGPGPLLGKILRDMLEARLAGEVTTKEQGYAFVDKWAAEHPEEIVG